MLSFSADAVSPTYDFDKLCVPLHAEMLRFAKRLTGGDAQRAADVVQESYLKAFIAWKRWVPVGDTEVAARAWMYRVVSNMYIKDYHRRRNVRRRNEQCHDEVLSGTYGRDREPDMRELLLASFGDEVEDALAQLTDDHRAVIDAFYIQELGCSEIAETLGIPKNTVFTRLARARVALEALLADFAEVEYGLVRRSSAAVRATEKPERVRSKSRGIDCVVARNDDSARERTEPACDQLAAG